MLMQVVPTDYQAIGHGNVLKEEIAIVILLGWKNSVGQPRRKVCIMQW